ncbi:hypothetical protein ACVIGB_000720 [Bradyrhizobium sp. USDA 4341]
MPMQKLLDLSTGHMTSKDVKLLEAYRADRRPSDMALIAYPYEYGWTVSTSGLLDGATERADRIAAIHKEGFSEHFIKVLTHAADHDAVLVRFDADAEFEPGLPRFDWENGDEMIMDFASPAP